MGLAATVLLSATAAGWSLGTVLVWIGGLVCGIVLAIALTTDWNRLPIYLRLAAKTLRRQAGWTALAAGSCCVLLFY